MTTKVVNIRGADNEAVYIGRPTKWGNPYRLGRNASQKERARVIEDFTVYLRSQRDLVDAARRELRGKTLACFCSPLACHGDVLARVADGEEP
jgi:hypothetical protein